MCLASRLAHPESKRLSEVGENSLPIRYTGMNLDEGMLRESDNNFEI